jgi:hypothetical protein
VKNVSLSTLLYTYNFSHFLQETESVQDKKKLSSLFSKNNPSLKYINHLAGRKLQRQDYSRALTSLKRYFSALFESTAGSG